MVELTVSNAPATATNPAASERERAKADSAAKGPCGAPSPSAVHFARDMIIPPTRPSALPTLTPAGFISTHPKFCASNHIVVTRQAVAFEGLPICLHKLHTLVLRSGGPHLVNQTNGWPTIGAYLKFVKYPQTDTQPARSGSDVAEHLQKIYMKYLAKFDAWFVDWACKSQLGLRAMQQSGMAPHEKAVVPAVRPHPVARGPPNNRVPGAVGAKPGFVTEPASSLHPVQAVHGRPGQRQALPRSSIQQVGEQPHP